MHIYNQYEELSFDIIYKVQLSNENKILMDKSKLGRFRKHKCCVFIDFEYIKASADWLSFSYRLNNKLYFNMFNHIFLAAHHCSYAYYTSSGSTTQSYQYCSSGCCGSSPRYYCCYRKYYPNDYFDYYNHDL